MSDTSNNVSDLVRVRARFLTQKRKKETGKKGTNVGQDEFRVCLMTVEDPCPEELKNGATTRYRGGWKCTFVGYDIPVTQSLLMDYTGKIIDSPYGKELHVYSVMPSPTHTRSDVVRYLKRFEGIGSVVASRIADAFKPSEIYDIIANHHEKLMQVQGVTIAKCESIYEQYRKATSLSEISQYLTPYKVKQRVIYEANKRWGSAAVGMIKANPFVLLDIRGVSFVLADEIARENGVMLGAPVRIAAGIRYVLREDSTSTGNVYMPLDSCFAKALEMLNAGSKKNDPYITIQDLADGFKYAQDERQIVVRQLFGKQCVFLSENDTAERDSAENLIRVLANPIDENHKKAMENALVEYCQNDGKMLSEKQRAACRNSLMNSVSIITGGPGTGKTTILKAVINSYMKAYPDAKVTLMAPTGKAARRMTESTGLDAKTIQSTIRMFDNDMNAADCQDLPGGLLIVDEMSMVDLNVMSHMMHCIQDPSAHLVMVGDVDQLPSVGAGSILLDMIESGVIPTARLTEVFRQANGAGAIVGNAVKINTGEFDLETNEHFMMKGALNEVDALERILRAYSQEVEKYGVDNVALLCPLRRKRTVSVDMCNARLQDICNPKTETTVCATVLGVEYRVNDRVIQMRNVEEASNGDIGVLTGITMEDEDPMTAIFTIRFDNGNTVEYNREAMRDVALAYAITIHKSQGSEYKSVIIPMISEQLIPSLFNRNLLYTGVTRAKDKVIIIGDRKAMNWCIEHACTRTRLTSLAKRLKSRAKKD